MEEFYGFNQSKTATSEFITCKCSPIFVGLCKSVKWPLLQMMGAESEKDVLLVLCFSCLFS